MKIEKKVLGTLEKCYAVAPLRWQNRDHLLIAAEKQDPCLLFDIDGNPECTVWEGPGGTMSIVQVPGSDGVFLATHKFYSPNDSKEAKIVCVRPENGGWSVQTVVELPFVHRFDILRRGGVNYLIACALKSGHEYKEDWTHPGKVFACVLPDDLSVYSEDNQLQLTCIRENMTRNHGYYKLPGADGDAALVSCEEGVFRFAPPAVPGGEWEIELLLDKPASDAVLLDLDGDGEDELALITPFHGNSVCIFHHDADGFRQVYEYPTADFAHAIYGGDLCGSPAVVIGHRKGARDLLAFRWDKEAGAYTVETIDHDCGPANVYHFVRGGKDVIVSTNREINEIAMYTIE